MTDAEAPPPPPPPDPLTPSSIADIPQLTRTAPPVDIQGLSATAAAEINDRWEISHDRWTSLAASIKSARPGDHWPWACAYVTGSLARYEAFELSDLDLFILNIRAKPPTTIDAASLITAIDGARYDAGFEPFSKGGAYLEPHSAKAMRRGAGSPQDDASNRFTARMLLLLNSMCLLNQSAYDRERGEILRLYWRDCLDEDRPYIPLFLINDIRRHWLTMCLNFEQDHPPSKVGDFDSRSPGPRRIGNLKLRATRLLDCYTPILALLHTSERAGVTRRRAWHVLNQTPLERLRDIANNTPAATSKVATNVIESYADYLFLMRQTEDVLQRRFSDDAVWNKAKNRATSIGDQTARLMEMLGRNRELYRFIVV